MLLVVLGSCKIAERTWFAGSSGTELKLLHNEMRKRRISDATNEFERNMADKMV